MVERKYGFSLLVALLVLLSGVVFGQYKMARSSFASGTAKSGTGYSMPEAASAQTVAKPVFYEPSGPDSIYLWQGFTQINQIPITFDASVYTGYSGWTHTDLASGNPVHVLYESFSNMSDGSTMRSSENVDAAGIYNGGVGHTVTIWIDEWADYKFVTQSVGSDESERWHANASALDYSGTIYNADYTDPVTSKSHAYFQQYNCDVDIQYSGEGVHTGKVNLVSWKLFANDGDPLTGYNDGTDWLGVSAQWADGGSQLEFPEQTDLSTDPWFTVNLRQWEPLDKEVTKVIVYGQTNNATLAAMIIWRGYTLMGVPLYPCEDTLSSPMCAYLTRAAATSFTPPAWPPESRGDQDVVLFDDFYGVCGVSDGGWPGKYGDWWQISKYYPTWEGSPSGAYRRYRGPGTIGSVEPFWPGRGFWLIQDHCDALPIDVSGTKVDKTEKYAIGLGKNNGSDYTSYNMVANPFYYESGEGSVHWGDCEVLNTATEVTKSLAEAIADDWIDPTCNVYRGGVYEPHNYSHFLVGDPDGDCIFGQWEGFWVKTKEVDDDESGEPDSLVLLMNFSSDSRRSRPSPPDNLLAKWSVEFGATCEELAQADLHNELGYKEFNKKSDNCNLTTYEMPDYTYPAPHLRVFFYDVDGNELSDLYQDERASVMLWDAEIDCRAIKGEKVTVKWSASDIPNGMSIHLKDANCNEYIDMLAQSEYSFIGGGDVYYVQIIVNAPADWVAKEVAEVSTVPKQFYLDSPMPNPFNASTRIEFGLANGDEGPVKVEVYDILGHKVNTLLDGNLKPGNYRFTWTGNDNSGRRVSSGTYFIRFDGAERKIIKKVSLIK